LNYYEILGVPKNASKSDIKKAFRQKAKLCHPDINPGDRATEAKFKEINTAYEVLNNYQKRSKYDQIIDIEKNKFVKYHDLNQKESNKNIIHLIEGQTFHLNLFHKILIPTLLFLLLFFSIKVYYKYYFNVDNQSIKNVPGRISKGVSNSNLKETPDVEFNKIAIDESELMQNGNIIYRYDDNTLYFLNIVDGAGPQDGFALQKSTDNGYTWDIITDLAIFQSGVCGLRFVSDEVGFILAKSLDGKSGILFRTDNSGVTFNQIEFPKVLVPSDDGEIQVGDNTFELDDKYFDTPELPNKSDSGLSITMTTGISDLGSYSGYKAFFESTDNGLTWEYIIKAQTNDY
jgi:hypothetical protein